MIPFHLFRRFLISLALLMVMSFFTFWLMHATPGNFFDSLKLNPQISAATIASYEQMYHLKDPFIVQYGHWLLNVCRGEFGYSFYYNVPAAHIIVSRLWNTFLLSLASLLLTWGLAIPLGVWAALRHGRLADRVMNVLSFAAFSVPSFFLAILLLYTVRQWGILPLGGMHSAGYDDLSWFGKVIDVARHLVIPAVVLSLASIAGLQRLMRGNMLAQLRQQYIVAARAKGLTEGRIIYRHALRNAFNPMVTLLGYEFASLLSGAALVEIVCSWPGLGALMLTAVRSKDVYVVMAGMLMGGVLLLLGNLLADFLLLRVDPRIKGTRT
ncbi:MAG: ABC transporter permease [Candidatus Omnitrophica bacterium]|nr:ABC transporter permease [Candidatus Omnitrophota bacterium]